MRIEDKRSFQVRVPFGDISAGVVFYQRGDVVYGNMAMKLATPVFAPNLEDEWNAVCLKSAELFRVNDTTQVICPDATLLIKDKL